MLRAFVTLIEIRISDLLCILIAYFFPFSLNFLALLFMEHFVVKVLVNFLLIFIPSKCNLSLCDNETEAIATLETITLLSSFEHLLR